MSSFARLSTLRRIASTVETVCDRFIRRQRQEVTHRAFRHLLIDPLEARELLSVSAMNVDDRMVTEGPGTAQVTNPGRSLAVDHDGDFVVVWTCRDELVERDPLTGEPILDPLTGEPIPIVQRDPLTGDPILDPLTGEPLPVVDPETGLPMTDANIYARYYTDEVQRITIPESVFENIDPSTNRYGTFSLAYGGPEVQKISISATYEPFVFFQSTISGTITLGFDVNGNGVIDPFDPGDPVVSVSADSVAPNSDLLFFTEDPAAEGTVIVFEDSGTETAVYDPVAKTLTFGITAGTTTAADIVTWLEGSPAGLTFSAQLDPATLANNGTGLVADTSPFNPPRLIDEGNPEASTTVVFPGSDNDLVFRYATPLPDGLDTEIRFMGVAGHGAPTFSYVGPGSPLQVAYDSNDATAQQIIDALAADPGLAGSSFTAELAPADGAANPGDGLVDLQVSAPMPLAIPATPAETTAEIDYDELMDPEINAENIELALWDLDLAFGSGTALQDVRVEALNTKEFTVHFSEATLGQDQPQILATEFDLGGVGGGGGGGFFGFGEAFLPAVTTSTVEEQIIIGNIPVSPTDPTDTATAISQRFLQTTDLYPIGPLKFFPPTGTPPNGPYNFGFSTAYGTAMRTAAPRVSVTPVPSAEGDLRFRQFDLTFVGDDGAYSGDAGKMDHPPLIVSEVRDGEGTATVLPPTDPIDLEELEEEGRVADTLKEPSPIFRVNPPEPDNPFTLAPDVYDQTNPSVAMDADGDFVIVWESIVPNHEVFGSFSDIFARRFSPAGIVDSPEFVQGVQLLEAPDHVSLYRTDDATFRVNMNTANPQFQPHVGMDDGGNFVIAWAEGGQDLSFFNGVRARRFDREGRPLSDEWLVNVEATTINFEPYVGMSSDGHFGITWTGTDDPAYLAGSAYIESVQAEIYDPEGTTLIDQFPVDGAGGATIAFDMDTNFVISWEELAANDNPTTFLYVDVFAKMYSLYLEEIQVLTITPNVPGFAFEGYFQLDIGGLTTNSILFRSTDAASVIGEIQKAITALGFREVTVAVAPAVPGEYAYEIRFRGDIRGVDQPDIQFLPGSLDATGTVTTIQDAGIGDTNTPIRDTFRVNSANLDPTAKTLWPWSQFFAQAAIDADGDLTVVYEGYGPDTSEDLMTMGWEFTEVLGRPENADLMPYFNGYLPWGMDSSGDVDSVLEEVLINAAANAPVVPPLGAALSVFGSPDLQTLRIDFGGLLPQDGLFYLTVDGRDTVPILFDSADLDGTAAAIASELESLSWFYTGVTVTPASTVDPYEFTIDFSTAWMAPFDPITASPTVSSLDATIYSGNTLMNQTLTVDPGFLIVLPLQGEFYLMVDGQQTPPIYFDSNDLDTVAASIQSELEQLSLQYAGVEVSVLSPTAPFQFQVDFFNAFSPPTTFIRGGGVPAPITREHEMLLGRLRAVMDEVGTLMRGEANGVMYSQWDADPQIGPLAVLSGDNVVNAHRDGHNTRYMIGLDYQHVHSGTFTIRVNGEDVTVPVAFTNTNPPFIDVFATADNINGALDGATSTGVNWPEYLPGVYERPIDVRVVNDPSFYSPFFSSELQLRQGTPWETSIYSPQIDAVYEVTFQGEMHDDINSLYLAPNGNNLFDNPIPEIQIISFTGAPNMEGWFSLQVGNDKFDADDDIWFPDITQMADRVTAVAALNGVASKMESGFAGAGYDNTVVVYDEPPIPDPPPDPLPPVWPPLPSPPYTFIVTFEAAGVDQPNITKIAPQSHDPVGDPNANPPVPPEPELIAGFNRIEYQKGGTPQSPAPVFLMHTYGDAGTTQGLASLGMQPDGNFVVAWSESVSGFYDDAQIFFRQFFENTDTAGPRVADLIAPDGTRIAEGESYPTAGGLQHLVLTFDEELKAVPDVSTQLEYLGIDPADASDSLLAELQRRFDDSALNPNNYRLLRDGVMVGGVLADVEFGMNIVADRAAEYGLSPIPSNKWEVILTFDNDTLAPGLQPLPVGRYAVEVLHPIPVTTIHQGQTGLRDKAGNPLGHTGFQEGGEDFSRTFDVVVGIGPGAPGNPDENATDDPANTMQAGDQSQPAVAIDENGDYVVVWVTHNPIPDPNAPPNVTPVPMIDQTDVVAQRFNRSGDPEGPEFIVSTYEFGNQSDPDVAMDRRGNFVVVWTGQGVDDTSGVFARRFDLFGRAQGDQFRVNQYRLSIQDEPSIAMDENGDFVITWTGYGQPDEDRAIYARRYDAFARPQGDEFRVNTTTAHGQQGSDVATNDDGDFVVVWESWVQDGGGWGVIGRRYNADGQPLGAEFRVNTYTTDDQDDPQVSMDAAGNFVVAWASYLQDGSKSGIYARRYDVAGNPRDAREFRVNQETEYSQRQPAVGMDKNGNFAVAWTTYDQDDEEFRDDGIFARMYLADGSDFLDDATGLPLGEFRVNATTVGNQVTPAVARSTNNGDYVVAWAGPGLDGTDIFSRLLDPPAEELIDPDTIFVPVVTNLVLHGQNRENVFKFVAGATPGSWIVELNGQRYDVGPAITSVEYHGGFARDTVELTGTDGDETLELWSDHGLLTGNGFSVTVTGVESITAAGLGGNDEVVLHDSPGNDTFQASLGSASLTRPDGANVATGFETVTAVSTHGGKDIAKLYDSSGNDFFVARPLHGELSGEGFRFEADGFSAVHAYATAGGFDQAKLFDSHRNDVFQASAIQGALYGPGYYNRAKHFETVHAYGSAGRDVAKLYDSAGDDLFEANSFQGALSGEGFYFRAKHFEEVIATAQSGGNDQARLYDSPGDDNFIATPTSGSLYGDGFNNQAKDFNGVTAFATLGGYDVAKLYDSAENDTFEAGPTYGVLYDTAGTVFRNRANGFDNVHAYATAGGIDVAKLFDSKGDDRFDASPSQSILRGSGFYNRARGFDYVHAYADAGGVDEAHLNDSAGNDLFEGRWYQGALSGQGYYARAKSFEKVHVHATAGGVDTAIVYDATLKAGLELDAALFAKVAWLYEFEQCFADSDSTGQDPIQQAVDEVLTAYWV